MILELYRLATIAATPAITLYLRRRIARGKEDKERIGERAGRAGLPRPAGALAWLHAASVGEANSALSLIARIRTERPSLHVLVTTGTVSSARLLAQWLPPGVLHQYVPIDQPRWVRSFLDHWRPDLALWVESELWPNLVSETQSRRVPMILLNGRMSRRSFERWQRAPAFVGALLSGFALCFAQSRAEGERFRTLGAGRVLTVGNLKHSAEPLPVDADALTAMTMTLRGRPLWLAASTHEGEEVAIAEAHRQVATAVPGLLTIIVPRHATRGAAIASALRAGGLNVAQRSAQEPVTAATEIYVADTMGELGLFYRVARVVFVGGSLVPHGGQNLLEPARLDCAILHGPHMANFQEIVDEMQAAGAARCVSDAEALGQAVIALLREPSMRERQARAARQVADVQRDVVERVLRELDPFLDTLAAKEKSLART
ncbi:MAG: 3-deoxy-D-manno-octulosonic acid transferase [Alphaproteobacteria bacterium]|mgnify:CR=1 FL=1